MATKKEKAKEISIGLNCYTIKFRKFGDKEKHIPYKEVFPKLDFKTLAAEFIKSIDTKAYTNIEQNRILYLEKLSSAKPNRVCGIIRKGHSGQETYVDEMKGAKANTVMTIKRDQYNTIPFFFLLSLPNPESISIFFLAQSYKQYGFKEVFEEAFKQFIRTKLPDDLMCEFGTLSVPSLFNKLLDQGKIRKLRFKKHSLGSNMENLLDKDLDDTDKTQYEVELSVKAKKKGFMGLKKKIKALDADSTPFIELLKVDGFDYDEAYADVSISGRKRSLNLSNPTDFAASYDITDKAGVNKTTNHPDFVKVEKEAIDILENDIITSVK